MNKKRIALTLLMAFLGEIANKIVPLVNLHLVAQRLGVEAFGLSQYALWLLDWGIILATFGFQQVAPALLRNVTSSEDQRKINGSVVLARLILATIGILLLILGLQGYEQLSPYKTAVYSSLFIIIASAVESTWILAAKQKLALLSLISIIAKLASVFAVYTFIHAPDDAVFFVIITSLVNSVIAISSFFVAIRLVGIALPNWQQVRNSFIAAAPFALAFILFWLVDRFDLYLVENYFGSAATGLYSAASKLVGSITPIVAAISAVFYSEMLAAFDQESTENLIKASLFWIISTLAPIVFLLCIFDEPVLRLVFGSAFVGGASLLKTLGVGAFFFAIVFIFGFQLLAIKQQWRPLLIALSFGALAGGLLGYFAVKEEWLVAVALSSILAKAVAGGYVMWSATKVWKLHFEGIIRGLVWPFLPTILLAGLVLLCSYLRVQFNSLILELSFLVTCYGLIFCAINLSEVKVVVSSARRRLVGTKLN